MRLLIGFAPGHEPDEKTHSMTIWKHEVTHASYFATTFNKKNSAYQRVGKWCVPNECDGLRLDYLLALASTYDDEYHYWNALLHAADYPTEELRDAWKNIAKDFKNDHDQDVAKVQ